MTRNELATLVLACYDAEMMLLVDRASMAMESLTDPQEIEQTLRIETRRSMAGLRKRTDRLLAELAFDNARPDSVTDIN